MLLLAVFKDLKVTGGEAFDWLAVLVGRYNVEHDQARFDGEHRRTRLRHGLFAGRLRRSLSGCLRGEQRFENDRRHGEKDRSYKRHETGQKETANGRK